MCSFQIVLAEEITIPSPSIVQEGMPEKLSEAEIENLKLYARDIKTELASAIKESEQLKGEQAVDFLKQAIAQISFKFNERSNVFVRYSLNRALNLVKVIEQEDQSLSNASKDSIVRLMRQSLKTASQYAEFDFDRYEEFDFSTYARFGADYYSLLVELSKSIFDASAQYHILKSSLEFLQWDLYRELNNKTVSPTIIKINRFLKTLPTEKLSDSRSVANIRIIRQFISSLDVRAYQNVVEVNEIQMHIDQAIEKNKDVDLKVPFAKGEELVFFIVGLYPQHPQISIHGRKMTYLQRDSIGIDHLVYPKGANPKKGVFVATALDLFKTKGCLRGREYCVGEPLIDYNGQSVTIIGLSGLTNIIVVENNKGEVSRGYAGAFYRRTGCREKMNACVGDKIVNQWDQKIIKVITAVGTGDNYQLFMIGDSIYDDKHTVTSPSAWAKL